MLFTKIKDDVIQKQTCHLKVSVIHIIVRAKFCLNLKNSWKESINIYPTWKVSHTRVLLVLIHHTTWSSHLVGTDCFSFSRNLLLSFRLLFLALFVIIKQVYLFIYLLFIYLFEISMSYLSLCLSWWNNFPSDLKMCKEVQNLHARFSPKNTKTLEPLSRGWHSQHAVKKVLDFAKNWKIPQKFGTKF